MGNCIDLVDSNHELTYKKQEHVISAGIGGRQRLPKGYVSDQANEIFSEYELKCLRYSPLAIERMRYGPGKRGSMNINRIDVPDVISLQPLLEDKSQDCICPLGFLFCNQVYLLPQIVVVFDNSLKSFNTVYIRATYHAAANLEEPEFYLNMKRFMALDQKNYKKVDIPFDTKRIFVCIGCYKKSFYICSNYPNFEINIWADIIMQKRPLKKFQRNIWEVTYRV